MQEMAFSGFVLLSWVDRDLKDFSLNLIEDFGVLLLRSLIEQGEQSLRILIGEALDTLESVKKINAGSLTPGNPNSSVSDVWDNHFFGSESIWSFHPEMKRNSSKLRKFSLQENQENYYRDEFFLIKISKEFTFPWLNFAARQILIEWNARKVLKLKYWR